MVGRMCLAVTITLAFPMLVIPGRDIVVRSIVLPRMQQFQSTQRSDVEEELAEPLLDNNNVDDDDDDEAETQDKLSFGVLLSISVGLFWSAAALASLVSSIDVVWDLLGSSLSILMSYLIPAGTYLVITKEQDTDEGNSNNEEENHTENTSVTTNNNKAARIACWLLLGGSVPLMIVSTANAVYNTFF